MDIDFSPLITAIDNVSITCSEAAKRVSTINDVLLSAGGNITIVPENNYVVEAVGYSDRFECRKLVCECCGGKISRVDNTCMYCRVEYV